MELSRDDDTLFAALIARDPSYEGFAYVGVTTTGVFCRLTCPARKPKRSERRVLLLHGSGAGCRLSPPACAASRSISSGRRAAPSRRCRDRIKAEPDRRWSAGDVRPWVRSFHRRRAFQREYGVTFARYMRAPSAGTGRQPIAAEEAQ